MISPETRMQIRRYFYAEHWKIGTIASALDVHPDAVRNAIESSKPLLEIPAFYPPLRNTLPCWVEECRVFTSQRHES